MLTRSDLMSKVPGRHHDSQRLASIEGESLAGMSSSGHDPVCVCLGNGGCDLSGWRMSSDACGCVSAPCLAPQKDLVSYVEVGPYVSTWAWSKRGISQTRVRIIALMSKLALLPGTS